MVQNAMAAEKEYPVYIGTKIVRAVSMKDNDFRKENNRPLVAVDNDGYMVVYDDGYKSWSPKEVFERSYRKLTKQEFEHIL